MNNFEMMLKDARAALVIVDVQNDYCHPQGALASAGEDVSGVKNIIPNLQKLYTFAKQNHIPCIFVQTIHRDATDSKVWKKRAAGRMLKICRPESWGAGAYGVIPDDNDIIVYKHRYSAFINTPLDTILRSNEIDTLILTGVATNICVESTARDAYMLDYQVVFMEDGTATFMEGMHEATLVNIKAYFGEVVKTDELIETWEKINCTWNRESKGA